MKPRKPYWGVGTTTVTFATVELGQGFIETLQEKKVKYTPFSRMTSRHLGVTVEIQKASDDVAFKQAFTAMKRVQEDIDHDFRLKEHKLSPGYGCAICRRRAAKSISRDSDAAVAEGQS